MSGGQGVRQVYFSPSGRSKHWVCGGHVFPGSRQASTSSSQAFPWKPSGKSVKSLILAGHNSSSLTSSKHLNTKSTLCWLQSMNKPHNIFHTGLKTRHIILLLDIYDSPGPSVYSIIFSYAIGGN